MSPSPRGTGQQNRVVRFQATTDMFIARDMRLMIRRLNAGSSTPKTWQQSSEKLILATKGAAESSAKPRPPGGAGLHAFILGMRLTQGHCRSWIRTDDFGGLVMRSLENTTLQC